MFLNVQSVEQGALMSTNPIGKLEYLVGCVCLVVFEMLIHSLR